MVKAKTRKAVKARFKITRSGKLIYNHPGRRHILTKKTSKRKRHLKKQASLSKSFVKTYTRLIGVA